MRNAYQGAPPSRRLVRRRPAGARETRAHQPAGGRRSSAALAILALFLFPSIAQACPVCFGNASGPMIDGVNNGIWVLLGILAFVQVGFVALFWSFWRRAKALRQRREQFHLIQGGIH